MEKTNEMRLVFDSRSINEGFSRAVVSAFAALSNPPVTFIADIKTAVSEAVTNSIVHGYRSGEGKIYITATSYSDGSLRVKIKDNGIGIQDIKTAMTPLFTTSSDERAGLGFAVMESFCDKVRVSSRPGKGTTVTLYKSSPSKESD